MYPTVPPPPTWLLYTIVGTISLSFAMTQVLYGVRKIKKSDIEASHVINGSERIDIPDEEPNQEGEEEDSDDDIVIDITDMVMWVDGQRGMEYKVADEDERVEREAESIEEINRFEKGGWETAPKVGEIEKDQLYNPMRQREEERELTAYHEPSTITMSKQQRSLSILTTTCS